MANVEARRHALKKAMANYRKKLADDGGCSLSVSLTMPAHCALVCYCNEYGIGKKEAITRLLTEWAERQPDGLTGVTRQGSNLLQTSDKALRAGYLSQQVVRRRVSINEFVKMMIVDGMKDDAREFLMKMRLQFPNAHDFEAASVLIEHEVPVYSGVHPLPLLAEAERQLQQTKSSKAKRSKALPKKRR